MVAGAVPVLAFPGLDLEFIAWFGIVPGLLLLRAAPAGREAAVRGWWFGTGYMLMAVYWLVPNLGPALLLVAIVLGSPWAGFGYAAWRLLRSPTMPRALAALAVLPACWILTEWLRSWQGLGGPWAVLGASQWQHPVVLALAAAGGMWLISFVVVAANTGIAIALTPAGAAGRAIGIGAALVAAGAGPAAYALTAHEYAVPPAGRLTLALVQPGLQVSPASTVTREIALTRRYHGDADLIVWGESSVGFDLDTDHALLARLARLSRSIGTQLLVSQDAVSPAGVKTKVAVLIGPAGIEARYVKSRLVPFGEYIPFRSALGWLTSVSRAAPENMAAGRGARVLHAVLPDGRGLPFGVLICFESAFPDMSRFDADHGAQVLVYQTSDSTFQGSWAPEQHASLAAVRAAETGRPAVQAALTGDTAAFDARGRLLAWAKTTDRGVTLVRLALPPASVRTPFDRFGDYVPWASIAIVAAAIGWAIARGRRGHTVKLPGTSSA